MASTDRRPEGLRLLKGGHVVDPVNGIDGVCDVLMDGGLIVRVGPEEGLILQVQGKQPGHGMRLRPVELDYLYQQDANSVESPSAYENLLLDAMRGKTTLFSRADEVEIAWEIVQPIVDVWESEKPEDFPNYRAGTRGPAAADKLLDGAGREWICF